MSRTRQTALRPDRLVSTDYFFGFLPSMTFTSPISRSRTDSPICSLRKPSNSSEIRFQAGSLCSRHASKSPYFVHSQSCAPAYRPNPRTQPYVPRYVQPRGADFCITSSFFLTHAWQSRNLPSLTLKLVL